MAKISNQQYIEERCQQCESWFVCSSDVKRGYYLWRDRIPICEDGNWFEWESRLRKEDFEED